MEPLELLKSVLDRYQTAMVVHWQSAELFSFLSLQGFEALHRYQFYDETESAYSIKRYIVERYGVILPDDGPEPIDLLDKYAGKKDRIDISPDDKWKVISEAWEFYYKWEAGTRKLYQQVASELLNNGNIEDFQILSRIVEDVSQEKAIAENIILDMKGTNYDLPHISDIQEPIKKQYTKKLAGLFCITKTAYQ